MLGAPHQCWELHTSAGSSTPVLGVHTSAGGSTVHTSAGGSTPVLGGPHQCWELHTSAGLGAGSSQLHIEDGLVALKLRVLLNKS